jgi:hypothetical protein
MLKRRIRTLAVTGITIVAAGTLGLLHGPLRRNCLGPLRNRLPRYRPGVVRAICLHVLRRVTADLAAAGNGRLPRRRHHSGNWLDVPA